MDRSAGSKDGFGTALPDEGAEHLERFAACQHQPRLPLTQRPVERFQRMMQPPGLRSAADRCLMPPARLYRGG